MLATILALKAWAVYRIAKMVSLFVRMARLASLKRLVLVRENFSIMLEKLCWFMLYGFRGLIRAMPLFLLSMVLTFINSRLHLITDAGLLASLLIYISKGLTILALVSLAASAIIWLVTWAGDYRSGYLPNWIRRDLY